MPVDLLKIPGVDPKRNRALARRLRPQRTRPMLGDRNRRDWVPLALGVGCTLIVLYLASVAWSATRVRVNVDGAGNGMAVQSAALAEREVTFDVRPSDRLERAEFLVDGESVPAGAMSVAGSVLTWKPGSLAEGHHEVTLQVPRPILGDSHFRWRFEIDDTPPGLDVPRLLPPVGICDPTTVAGVVEPGSTLALAGEPVKLDDGAFSLHLDRPPMGPLDLVATDRAGNQTTAEVFIPVSHPGGQGVHVTASGWEYEPLRRGIFDLINAGLISVVQLDIKDEGGIVGYASTVPLASEIGAILPSFPLRETVAELKARGVRVVGRIVAFRDSRLARWAWANDRRDWVVQTSRGDMLETYGGFTNPVHPGVQQYNIDLALEAVDAGVDDILWDYIRRPEGNPDTMVLPGLVGTPADGVVAFLAKTHAALRERCAYQGATVFGISADRPQSVAQDIPRMARHVEYVSPMLYPSHWVKGEYGVADPVSQPGDIVTASLAAFQKAVAVTGIGLMPWLQDFSLGYSYGPREVRAQIDASRALGVNDWFLWNAGVRYTAEALDPSLIEMG